MLTGVALQPSDANVQGAQRGATSATRPPKVLCALIRSAGGRHRSGTLDCGFVCEL